MSEQPDDLKKLAAIASDLGLSVKLRIKAIDQIGSIVTHDALLALLGLAANEKLSKQERESALKYARQIIKSER